jgi:predicted MPP superfamily phosphohydrolase
VDDYLPDESKSWSQTNGVLDKTFGTSVSFDYVYKKWSVLIEDCGFINLNDTYELIYKNSYKPILLAGVSNNTYTTKNIKDKTETIFNHINSEKNNSSYNILLMHEPDYIDDIDYSKFDLVLAGHSHNGQVRIPFIGATILPDGAKKYYKEYYKLEDTKLYISSGIGTTILPIRLFNKPSYNFYRIIKK